MVHTAAHALRKCVEKYIRKLQDDIVTSLKKLDPNAPPFKRDSWYDLRVDLVNFASLRFDNNGNDNNHTIHAAILPFNADLAKAGCLHMLFLILPRPLVHSV
jgi:hypothetical protein